MQKRGIIFAALFMLFAAATTVAEGGQEVTGELLESGDYTVWTGEWMTFTKADGADPTLEENQDRITDSVWITRGNEGGQIINIVERERYSKSGSPVGTYWAVGTTDELTELEFAPFRTAVRSPKEVVGMELVMFIEEEQIFLDVEFLSWSQGKDGGFSYRRRTPAEEQSGE